MPHLTENKYRSTHLLRNPAVGDSKERDALYRDILVSGISAAFFPHGVGHSLGMDVHDVPTASKPPKTGKYFITDQPKSTIQGTGGHESFYKFLRLRLSLLPRMVVVSRLFVLCFVHVFLITLPFLDRGAGNLLLSAPPCAAQAVALPRCRCTCAI